MNIDEITKELVSISERYCKTVEDVMITKTKHYQKAIKVLSIVILLLFVSLFVLAYMVNKNLVAIQVLSEQLSSLN